MREKSANSKQDFPKGILLDLGCRDRKEKNFVGMDSREFPGVDILQDLQKFPYPLDDESCLTIKAAHVIEHIKPCLILKFMDELWRILKPNGQLAISAPYAGSPGYFQDPTHCTMITERTFQHFDPAYPLYSQYNPKPWKVEHSAYKPDGNIEAILRKVIPVDMSDSMRLAAKAIELGAIQKPTELLLFLESLKGKSLKTVVEIGTAKGGLFYALCQRADEDARIISIDLPGGAFGGGYSEEAAKKFRKFGKPGQKLCFIRDDSHKASTRMELLKIIGKDKIDLLLIDGDHTCGGVKLDWDMYSPMVRKGGIIVFHDICHHPNMPEVQVDKFWKRVKKGKKVVEYIDSGNLGWGGIGVITK